MSRGVLVDAIWAHSRVRNIALVVGAAALTAAAAQVVIPVPGSPVPVTLQTFAVLVTAAGLGATRGALGQLLYLAVGALGVPVFHNATGGAQALFGATGGYLLGFVVAAYAIGRLSERGADRKVVSTALAYVVGSVIIYGFGVTVLTLSAGQSLGWGLQHGLVPFLVGDALKALAAAGALPLAWRAVRGWKNS
ncbi:MAG TPA: biotin transporter BioY [Micromonosporaceae bacterium]|nr:biotin transporter BioY [Micromonosporaceae bacterium]